jgi:pimeloyl-ACP methyl ester carboxylesterase
MPTYEREGLRLDYAVEGDGPPLVFAHGATGTAQFEWNRLAGVLADGYRCLLPDLRGHGRSDYAPGSLGLDPVGEDLLELIANETDEPPSLVGFSFGAEVVLNLEIRHPGTARSLVLISPGTGNADGQMPSREKLAKVWPSRLKGLQAEHHGPDHWWAIMEELWSEAATRPKLTEEELASVACPVLMVVGGRDDPRRQRQAAQFAELNPRAQLVKVDDAAHSVHGEQPDQVATTVRAFLDQIAPKPVTSVLPKQWGR